MPGALTASLSAPLHRLRAMLGPGSATQPAAGVTALARRLDAATGSIVGVDENLRAGWAGGAATAGSDRLAHALAAARHLADLLALLGDEIAAAADAVTRVRAELERMIADFEARAAALEAQLDTPGAVELLEGEARRAHAEALRMVDGLRTELDTGARNVTSQAPAPAPAAAVGAGSGAPMMAAPMMGAGAVPAAGTGTPTEATLVAHRGEIPDAAQFGAGDVVQLPDGSTAVAPNAVAASAVRHALTQLGVPYQWGGTTAGVGLDCSGLTQWAYREAGLDIPRLAQEQDVGATVDAGSLRPGDLAVWDGHVAMVVGDNVMVEAGDPVQLSAIRTTNAGQGFQGFWRPTA